MTRKHWVDMALVVMALVAWGAVFATERLPTTGQLLAREHNLLPAFEEDEVRALELEAPERLRIEASEGEHRFLMVAPEHAVADDARVDGLLRALRYASFVRQLPTDGDAARYGLDAPSIELKLELGGGTLTLLVGAEAATPKGARYLAVRGGARPGIYVVAEGLVEAFRVTPAEFRITRLLTFPERDLRSLRLSRAGQATAGRDGVALEHRALEGGSAGGWYFGEAFKGARVSGALMNRLFAEMARLQSRDWVAVEQATELQREHPALVALHASATRERSLDLMLGGPCPGSDVGELAVRVQPEPLAACVQVPALRALLARPEQFIDAGLTSFRADEVEALEIERLGDKLSLVRSEEGFHMRSPRDGNVPQERGQLRVEALANASGEWLSTPPPGTRERPHAQLVYRTQALSDDKPGREERLTLYGLEDSPFVYAERHDDGAWLRLGPGIRNLLSVDDVLLRSLEVLRLEPSTIRRIQVNAARGMQVLVRTDERWRMERPAGLPVDEGVASELVEALAHLSAEAWVQSSVNGEFGFDAPTLRVQLATESEQHELIVGAPAPAGGRYASLDGQGVFRLGEAELRRLDTWVIDRSAFRVDRERLTKVTVRGAGGQHAWVLEALGDEWVQTAGPVLGPARSQELIDVLGRVQPLAVASVTGEQSHHGLGSPALEVEYEWQNALGESPPSGKLAYVIGAADAFEGAAVYYARSKREELARVVFVVPRQGVLDVLALL